LAHEINQDIVYLMLSILASEASWFGVGFSESGHMLGADLLVVEMDNEVTFRDMFVPWDASPPSPWPVDDSCNDWTMVCHSSADGIKSFVFSRKISTGDTQVS
jgi:hypothetical protein